jgi:hypothetical protein
VGGDAGQWGALTAHKTTDERRERGPMSGNTTCRLARIPLGEGLSYGTIPAEGVTHRLLLLEGSRCPESINDETTSNYTFQNDLQKCPVEN